MAIKLISLLWCFILVFGVIFADLVSQDTSYYEYCRIMENGEKRQECRLLRDENMILHSKFEAKRQVNVASNNGSDGDSLPSSGELSTYLATTSLVAFNQNVTASSGSSPAAGNSTAVNATAATSTGVNGTSAVLNATSATSNASSTLTNATSSVVDANTTATSTAANVSSPEVGATSTVSSAHIPIVGSDVIAISHLEIKNNSVPSGEERADAIRRFRDMVNSKPWLNDTSNDDDHEFDDLFNTINDFINNNKTLKQNNITKYEEDHHQYYNSSFVVSEEISQKFWVTMSERENVQTNDVLSNAHRRAVTVKLSFDFPFYGHMIRNLTVATGGFLFTGEYVHSWLAATQYVAPLMANFDTSLSNRSAIKYVDNGTAFTVEWDNVILRDEPHLGVFTFQVTLLMNGDVVFVYKQVPVVVENIRDTLHPVKVGLSDAYISDRVIFFIRRKTIYEYHRVEFSKEDIRNWTVIYLSALPTCVSKNSCYECLSQVPGFECSWCPAVGRCSNGVDRHRKDWFANSCDKSAYEAVHMCPGMQYLGNSLNMDAALSPQEVSMAKRYNSSHMPGILAVIFLVAIVGSFSLWVVYAYRNPHTPSGQFLIRYRPSQWRWRRGEARYTAATIHM